MGSALWTPPVRWNLVGMYWGPDWGTILGAHRKALGFSGPRAQSISISSYRQGPWFSLRGPLKGSFITSFKRASIGPSLQQGSPLLRVGRLSLGHVPEGSMWALS